MTEFLADILASAAAQMYKEQASISKFTSETKNYEPNLSFHYATCLRRLLFWLDCDFDVIKPNLDDKRPDIIFHKRGVQSLNFLAVEVKRHQADAEDDIGKIKANWFKGSLAYRFGASVVLDIDKNHFSVRLLQRIPKVELVRDSKTPYNNIVIPEPNPEKRQPIAALVDQILATKQQYLEPNTKVLNQKLDQQIYVLYNLPSVAAV